MTASTEGQIAAEVMRHRIILSQNLIRGQRDLVRPLAIDPTARQLAFAPAHVAPWRLCTVEVIRDFPEGPQDHRVFELAEIGTSPPKERYRPSDRLTADHRLRTRIAAAS
jgi:hypothetical protein